MSDGLDVLLVEDAPAIRIALREALEEAGHRVTEAEDGQQGLALVMSRSFHMAILDIHLPKLNGLTIFRRLRNRAPGTLAIITTSDASIADAVDAMRDGAYDFVTKPFDPVEFVARRVQPAILEIARRWAAAGEPDLGRPRESLRRAHSGTRARVDIPIVEPGSSGHGTGGPRSG